jgi:hypothetical protein
MRITYKVEKEDSFIIPDFDEFLTDNWKLTEPQISKVRNHLDTNPIYLSHLSHYDLSEVEDAVFETESGSPVWEEFDCFLDWFLDTDEDE